MFIEFLVSFEYIIYPITSLWQSHRFNIKSKISVVFFFPHHSSPFTNKVSCSCSSSWDEQNATSLQRLFILGLYQPVCHKMQVCMAKLPGHTRIFEQESWSGNWSQVSSRALTTKLTSMRVTWRNNSCIIFSLSFSH